MKFPPSYCGLTTYSLNIFISSFGSENKASPTVRAATYITYFHEIGHKLRRISFEKKYQVRNSYTPPSGTDTFHVHEEDYEVENKRNRGEAGNLLEKEIFGGIIRSINKEAALFLINHDQQITSEEFQKKFMEMNADSANSISLTKGNDFFSGVKCPMRFM